MGFVLSLGDMSAEALRAAGHAEARGVHDEFSFGPLGDLCEPAAFFEARARYWAEILIGLPCGVQSDEAETLADARKHLAEDAALLEEAFSSGGPVEVWATESLQELMFLACCASLARPGAALSLRRPGPGETALGSGLGSFPPETLRDAAPPHLLSGEEIEGLRRFWAALTAPTPEPLRAFAAAPPASPTGLGAAAAARLARLPHPITGLDSVETRMLTQLARLGPQPCTVARIIGEALRAGRGAPDNTGDLSMHDALRRLAEPRAPHPLVILTGDGTMRGTEVVLTPFGRDVLAGRADRVSANGWRTELGGLSIDAPPGGGVPRAPA